MVLGLVLEYNKVPHFTAATSSVREIETNFSIDFTALSNLKTLKQDKL